MKKIFFLANFFIFSCSLFAQYTHHIKADSVRIYNDSCKAELILENSTKNVNGFLYNNGNGRTEFRKALLRINDSVWLIGEDTLNTNNSQSASNNYIHNQTSALQEGGFNTGAGYLKQLKISDSLAIQLTSPFSRIEANGFPSISFGNGRVYLMKPIWIENENVLKLGERLTDPGDFQATSGSMYYNNLNGRFRGYANGAFGDFLVSNVLGNYLINTSEDWNGNALQVGGDVRVRNLTSLGSIFTKASYASVISTSGDNATSYPKTMRLGVEAGIGGYADYQNDRAIRFSGSGTIRMGGDTITNTNISGHAYQVTTPRLFVQAIEGRKSWDGTYSVNNIRGVDLAISAGRGNGEGVQSSIRFYVPTLQVGLPSTEQNVVEVGSFDGITQKLKLQRALTLGNLSTNPTGERGDIYFDTVTNSIKIYISGSWKKILIEGDEGLGSFSQSSNDGFGSSVQSGNGSSNTYSIPHGFNNIPTWFNAIATSASSANISYVTATATHIIVHYSIPPSSGNNNLSWNWSAKQ